MTSRQLIGLLALTASALIITDAATAKTGNASHDALIALPPDQQAATLGKLDPDNRCTGISAFFRGMGQDNAAYWSVHCKNDESYMIGIKSNGKTTALECSVAKIIGIDCFKTFSEEQEERKAKMSGKSAAPMRDTGAINLCPAPRRMTQDGCK